MKSELTDVDIPQSSASDAANDRAVNMRLFALDRPRSLVTRCVPPAPGIMPRRVSGSPILETSYPNKPHHCLKNSSNFHYYVPATRKSHASPNSNPPPSAGPSIAAMVGNGRFSSVARAPRKSARNLSTCCADIVRRSARSAPAQKEPGVEERTTSTRTLA